MKVLSITFNVFSFWNTTFICYFTFCVKKCTLNILRAFSDWRKLIMLHQLKVQSLFGFIPDCTPGVSCFAILPPPLSRTATIWKTLSPFWGEEYNVHLPPSFHTVCFHVLDEGFSKVPRNTQPSLFLERLHVETFFSLHRTLLFLFLCYDELLAYMNA